MERELDRSRNREYKRRNLLETIVSPYDWVFIDCPPDLEALADNAINAARNVIVPVQAEGTSTWALELLLDQIETIERELRIPVEILAIIPNLVQTSTTGREIVAHRRLLLAGREAPSDPRRKAPKEPWYLATRLGDAGRAAGALWAGWYWRRGWIEQRVKDSKSGFGMDAAQIRCPRRLSACWRR